MQFKKLIIISTLSLGAFSANANNLYKELEYMQQYHPLLYSAKAQTISTEQALLAAKGARTPVVSLSAQAGFEHQQRPNDVRTAEDPETASLSVSQLLWDFGATGNSIDAARARIDAAGANTQLTSQDLLQSGIKTYFALSFAYDRFEHAKESVNRILEQKELEAKKMKRGKGSKADFLQAESQLLAAQARVASEEGAVQIAVNAYWQVFGKQPPPKAYMLKRATPSIALPGSLQQAEQIALKNAPGLVAARASMKAAYEQIGAAEGSYYPRFDLVAEGEYRNDAQAVIGEVSEGRVFVRMSYDFDLGFSRRGIVGAAKADHLASFNQKANQERIALEAIRSSWQRHVTAKKNYDISLRQLDSATEFLELANKERELGKRTLQDILNGELVRLSAKTRLANARTELTTSAFDILRATGQLSLQAL